MSNLANWNNSATLHKRQSAQFACKRFHAKFSVSHMAARRWTKAMAVGSPLAMQRHRSRFGEHRRGQNVRWFDLPRSIVDTVNVS